MLPVSWWPTTWPLAPSTPALLRWRAWLQGLKPIHEAKAYAACLAFSPDGAGDWLELCAAELAGPRHPPPPGGAPGRAGPEAEDTPHGLARMGVGS